MNKYIIALAVGFLFIPAVSFAQTTTYSPQYISLLEQLLNLLEQEVAIYQNQTGTVPAILGSTSTDMSPSETASPVTVAYKQNVPSFAVLQDGGSYPVGTQFSLTPLVAGLEPTHQLITMEFSTNDPDGFNRIGGHTSNQPATTSDQTVQMWSDGLSGSVGGTLTTPGTYVYTLTLPDYDTTYTVNITVL